MKVGVAQVSLVAKSMEQAACQNLSYADAFKAFDVLFAVAPSFPVTTLD